MEPGTASHEFSQDGLTYFCLLKTMPVPPRGGPYLYRTYWFVVRSDAERRLVWEPIGSTLRVDELQRAVVKAFAHPPNDESGGIDVQREG